MFKIDAHQHFWQYNQREYGWMGPGLESLRTDYMPADLRPLLNAAGFDGAIAVQARQSVAETSWLLGLADEYPFIKGVVGWVDLCSPRLGQQLAHFAAHPKFRGVRHVLQDEPDDHFMLRDDFQRGIGLLAEFDLTYDLLLFPRHLPSACEVVARFPEQPFVLDHLAKPFIKTGRLSPWADDVRRLAAFPNVFAKVSGLVTEADWQKWQPADFRPYLDVVFDAFGPERLMFGSDWPVCTLAAGYQQVHDVVAGYLSQQPAEAQSALFGETALRCYSVKILSAKDAEVAEK